MWCSFRGSLWLSMRGRIGWRRLTRWSIWSNKDGPVNKMSRGLSLALRARCDGINDVFEEGGLAALGRTGGYPLGRTRVAAAREQLIQRLKAQGVGQREIARRMGVSEKAIRNLLRRLGWKAASPVQNQLPLETTPLANPSLSGSMPAASSSPLASTQCADPNLSAFCPASPPQPRYRSG